MSVLCGSVAQAASCLSVAALRDSREGDGVQVGPAQPLAGGPLRGAAAVLLAPGRGEGRGKADGGRQGGGAVGPETFAVPLALSTTDGGVRDV